MLGEVSETTREEDGMLHYDSRYFQNLALDPLLLYDPTCDSVAGISCRVRFVVVGLFMND